MSKKVCPQLPPVWIFFRNSPFQNNWLELHLPRKKNWRPYVKIGYLHHFMCSIIIVSFRKTAHWGENNPRMGSKAPAFLLHSQHLSQKCIIRDNVKMLLSDIKIKVLINSLHFWWFFRCPLTRPSFDWHGLFSVKEGVKVVHKLGKFYWYGVSSSQVLNFQMFSY